MRNFSCLLPETLFAEIPKSVYLKNQCFLDAKTVALDGPRNTLLSNEESTNYGTRNAGDSAIVGLECVIIHY